MLEEGKISGRQAAYLLITTILVTSLVFLPGFIYREAHQDSWIAALLVTVFGLVIGIIITVLGKRFPKKTIIEYSETITGKITGKIIGLFYILFFIHINALIIREFVELFKTAFMPDTPLVVFTIGILAAAAYAIRSGLEVLVRTNEIMLPLILFLLTGIILLVLPEFQLKPLTPVLERGITPVLEGTYLAAPFFGDIIIMVMLFPYLNQTAAAGGIIARSLLVVGLFQLLATLTIVGVLGSLTGNLHFPGLELARTIQIGKAVENMDPLILLTWVGGGFVKVSIFYYCAVLATAQWLNLRDYKSLVLPIGIILGTLSIMLWDNIMDIINQEVTFLIPVYLFFQLGLPLILLALAVLRGRREDKH